MTQLIKWQSYLQHQKECVRFSKFFQNNFCFQHFFYSSDKHRACCNVLQNSCRIQSGLVFYQVSSVSKPNSEVKNCFISFLPSFYFLPFFFPLLNVVFDSLPPAHYKETMNTILMWMQQSETKLSMPQVAIAEYEIMEQRLREFKVSD